MRRLALAVLFLVADCGENVEAGESGACADAVVWHDTVYFGARLPRPRPPVGEPTAGGIQPACNDSNGEPPADDRQTDLWRVQGISPEIAVYADDIRRDPYLNPGAFTELPQHPLHANYYGGPRRPLRWVRGKPCTFDGRVKVLSAFVVDTTRGERNVIIDARTQIVGFDGGEMPILRERDTVRIRGLCRGESVLPPDRAAGTVARRLYRHDRGSNSVVILGSGRASHRAGPSREQKP